MSTKNFPESPDPRQTGKIFRFPEEVCFPTETDLRIFPFQVGVCKRDNYSWKHFDKPLRE